MFGIITSMLSVGFTLASASPLSNSVTRSAMEANRLQHRDSQSHGLNNYKDTKP